MSRQSRAEATVSGPVLRHRHGRELSGMRMNSVASEDHVRTPASYVERMIDSLCDLKDARHLVPELRRNHRSREIEEYLVSKRIVAQVAIPAYWHYYEEQIRREVGLPPAPPADPLVRVSTERCPVGGARLLVRANGVMRVLGDPLSWFRKGGTVLREAVRPCQVNVEESPDGGCRKEVLME